MTCALVAGSHAWRHKLTAGSVNCSPGQGRGKESSSDHELVSWLRDSPGAWRDVAGGEAGEGDSRGDLNVVYAKEGLQRTICCRGELSW